MYVIFVVIGPVSLKKTEFNHLHFSGDIALGKSLWDTQYIVSYYKLLIVYGTLFTLHD